MCMDNVWFLFKLVQIMSLEWDVLIEVFWCLKLVLVIVDIQVCVMFGVEENFNMEMGWIVDCFDQMWIMMGVCVVIVYYIGYVGEYGCGVLVVKGVFQLELYVFCKGDKILNIVLMIKLGKQKDEDQDGDFQFGLKKVFLDGEYKFDGWLVMFLVLVFLDVLQDGL